MGRTATRCGCVRREETGIGVGLSASQSRAEQDRCAAIPHFVHLDTHHETTVHQGEGLFWLVVFNNKFRKYFAPLNGEIKPDTPHTRKLLDEAGWSESDRWE